MTFVLQLARVEELVEDAKASGARVVAGGSRFNPNGKNGFFYEPTILADVQEGVRIVVSVIHVCEQVHLQA